MKYRYSIGPSCNYDCLHCAYHHNVAGDFVSCGEVKSDLKRIRNQGYNIISLTGGEPSLHPELPEIIEHAKALDFDIVELETNGAVLLKRGALHALNEAGLDQISLLCPGYRKETISLISKRRDAGEHFYKTLDTLNEFDFLCYFIVPILRWNLLELPLLVKQLSMKFQSAVGFQFDFPDPRFVPVKNRNVIVSYTQAAPYLWEAYKACRTFGVEFGPFRYWQLPPCASSPFARYKEFHQQRTLFLTKERISTSHLSICRQCVLIKECPGLETETMPYQNLAELKPVADGVKFSRGSILNISRYKIGQSDVTHYISRGDVSDYNSYTLARVNSICNEKCAFCFVNHQTAEPAMRTLVRRIKKASDRGFVRLVISGGEPTLRSDLVDLIQTSRESGFRCIELQTNGVTAANRDYATRLIKAGVTEVSVSLHGSHSHLSDTITGVPGSFEKTSQGLKNFLDLGVDITIVYVIFSDNLADPPDFVRMYENLFSSFPKPPKVCFSVAHFVNDEIEKKLIPRWSEIKVPLMEALDLCLAKGIQFGGLGAECGLPPCILEGKLEYYPGWEHKMRSALRESSFVFLDRCKACQLILKCQGIRKRYLEVYGPEEIHPI